MSHTPGPWFCFDDEIIAEPGDTHVSDVPLRDGTNPTEWQDNMHLIAAAPDLLAALKLYVEHFGDPLKVARAAITKAEVRSRWLE